MKVKYRGYEIEVKRERCLGGWSELYTTIYRLSDGLECVCYCEDSAEKVVDQVRYMKKRIDDELASDNPWCEQEASNV